MRIPVVEMPPELFPLKIEFFAISTGAKVWETTVLQPEGVYHRLRIPPLVSVHGAVRARITYGDGEVHEAETACDQEAVQRYAALLGADTDLRKTT